MKQIILILSVFIGIMACQQEDGSKISDKYQELFKLSKETEDEITSSDECKSLKKSLSGFAQYKEYYAAHGKAYQKDYCGGARSICPSQRIPGSEWRTGKTRAFRPA